MLNEAFLWIGDKATGEVTIAGGRGASRSAVIVGGGVWIGARAAHGVLRIEEGGVLVSFSNNNGIAHLGEAGLPATGEVVVTGEGESGRSQFQVPELTVGSSNVAR